MKKRLSDIVKFFLEGKNWGYIVITALFVWFADMFYWFNLSGGNQIDFVDNLVRPVAIFRLLMILPLVVWFLASLWVKENPSIYFIKTARYFAYIIPLELLAFFLPLGKSWVGQFSDFFQIFVLGLGLTLGLYFVLVEPFLKSVMYLNLKKRKWDFLPWVIVVFGFLIYGLASWLEFNNLGYPIKDVTVFDQAIWHLSHFQIPESTVRNISNLWGDHFHPILILLAPLYWLKSDVRVLLLAQALLISLGAWPIYQIAKFKLKSHFLAFTFAFCWLFYLGIQHALSFGFYPETLAITFLGYAIYFIIKDRKWLFLLFALLAMMCKENIALYIFALSVYFFFFERKKIGLISGAVSLIWFALAPKIVAHIGGAYIYFFYGQLGQNFIGVVKTILTNPVYVLKTMINPAVKVDTMLYFFMPLAFLPFLTPFFIVLLPNLAEKFLSSNPLLWQMGFHYAAGISTFLFVGAIYGAEKILKKNYFKKIPVNKIAFMGTLILMLNFLVFLHASGPLSSLFRKNYWKSSLDPEITVAYKYIPNDASLSVQNTLGPGLGHREKIYLWDENPAKGDYILLSWKYSTYPLSSVKTYKEAILRDLNNQNYGVLYADDVVLVLKKDETNKNLPVSWQNHLDL